MTEHDETLPDDDELSPETADAAMRILVRQCRDQAEAAATRGTPGGGAYPEMADHAGAEERS